MQTPYKGVAIFSPFPNNVFSIWKDNELEKFPMGQTRGAKGGEFGALFVIPESAEVAEVEQGVDEVARVARAVAEAQKAVPQQQAEDEARCL